MLPALLVSLICFSPQATSGRWISSKAEVRYVWDEPQATPSDNETTHTIPKFTGDLPIVDFTYDNYPFPEGTIRPEDFSVFVGETSPTMMLGDGELAVPVTVRYAGKGVVWQPHPTREDFLVVECVQGRESLDPVARKTPCIWGRTISERMRHGAMSSNPSPWASGVVFCGGGVAQPDAVRQEYLERWLQPGPKTNVPDEEFRVIAETFVDMAKDLASRIDFVGDTWTGTVKLADYWKPREVGQYAFRIGIYIYPSVTANNWAVPLDDRKVIWSEPFALDVRRAH